MPSGSLILLVPSMAAAVELPRRLAATGRALAGIYPFKLLDLARAVAEPALLGAGLKSWDTGHDALVAARLLDGPHGLRLPQDVPRDRVAAALARTLSALRMAGAEPEALQRVARAGTTGPQPSRSDRAPEDQDRLRAIADLYRRYDQTVEGRFADPATLLKAAERHLGEARWLEGASVLIVEDLELDALETRFLAALARRLPARRLGRPTPPGLEPASFRAWAEARGIATVAWPETLLAPLAPAATPAGLARLRGSLFEPPAGDPVHDGSVELLTAPGEAAEVRSIVRRLLREAARGVPFEEMGVVLPRPADYAPLLTDLLQRLGIPHRLHPSLPLKHGRCARALLLLLRCRGLRRAAVMEFLTFAPIPFGEMLGEEVAPKPAQWDEISRDARVVADLARWIVGLRAHGEAEREAGEAETDPARRERRFERFRDAEALLRVVELLSSTLESLAGEASWPEWSARLREVCDQWIGADRDREAVLRVIADLAALGSLAPLGARAPWSEVEQVLEARFEWERLPLDPVAGGAVHVGALDAIAGLPFRVLAIPGLVEGGYPGVLRPDPFLLDPEREELVAAPAGAERLVAKAPRAKGQLSLFDALEGDPPAGAPETAGGNLLPTTQDRLLEARRLFHRALSQATERLILSYPRADPRTGRERMPSLFFVAAASALEGRPLGALALERLVVEDDLDTLSTDEALDASERDRLRVRKGGDPAAEAIAGGSLFFKQSRLASRARWSSQLTPYDGLIAYSPRDGVSAEVAAEVSRKLDPIASRTAVSASRLALFARCGFQYLLRYVLKLEPTLEPEERKRLEPLERGNLFHEVAERFLRERRDLGELPVRNTEAARARLLELADAALHGLVAGSPPRFAFLWERECGRFRETMLGWLAREAEAADRMTPAHFEVSFGSLRHAAPGEPHSAEPLAIDLGDGRTLLVSGKIDRIDRRPDGTLVLRDYKTGKAPRDDGGVFRGGAQLQIPFYLLAAETLFPGQTVVEAFLDYVDGGRRVALDPATVRGEEFPALLRGLLDAISQGLFVQEPSACDWCDFTSVCGPKPLLERRRRYKLADKRVQQVLHLRDVV